MCAGGERATTEMGIPRAAWMGGGGAADPPVHPTTPAAADYKDHPKHGAPEPHTAHVRATHIPASFAMQGAFDQHMQHCCLCAKAQCMQKRFTVQLEICLGLQRSRLIMIACTCHAYTSAVPQVQQWFPGLHHVSGGQAVFGAQDLVGLGSTAVFEANASAHVQGYR